MLHDPGQDRFQTSRAHQSHFSLGVTIPVGNNFKMRRWVDKWVNAWTERLSREMDRQIKLPDRFW